MEFEILIRINELPHEEKGLTIRIMKTWIRTRAQSLLEQTMSDQNAAGTLILIEPLLMFLLQRGPKGAEPLTWAVAGGRIEEGETPYQAAIRETQEEIQIDLQGYSPAFSFSQPIPGESGRIFTTFVYKFPHIPQGWSPMLNEESLAFGFFTKPAVSMLPLHPGMNYALKKIGWA